MSVQKRSFSHTPILVEQTELDRASIFKYPIRLGYSDKQCKRHSCFLVTQRSYISIGTRAFTRFKSQVRPLAELRALSERNASQEEFKSLLEE